MLCEGRVAGYVRCVYSRAFQNLLLEEDCAAAPHDGGLALGGMRRLCIAGKGGKEPGRKGKENFPKPYVV